MVRTHGGHRFRPRGQTRTLARDGTGTSGAATDRSPAQGAEAPPAMSPAIALMQSPASAGIPDESQGAEPPSRRYHTRVGPWPPSPVHPRPPRRVLPSMRARTSDLGESSHSRPEPSSPPATQSSSPQLSSASRIRRPLFSCDPIPGNVNCYAKDFHRESHYDIPALEADPRFRDSMRLVQRYSLLSFMTPRQFFYPRVVLEFYHTMTSRGVSDQMQLQFSIDGRPGILRASDITAALGLPVVLANSADYQHGLTPHLERWFARSLEIQQPDLSFFGGSYLRRCSSHTMYFGPIYSRFSIICSAEELFLRLCTGYPRGSGSIRQSLS